jgi:hypothetical protein
MWLHLLDKKGELIMKKLITILFGVLLVLGMSVPAMATVLVWGTVCLDKDITVDETVIINKTIDIIATVDVDLVKAAEADSLVNQDNASNEVKGLGVVVVNPETGAFRWNGLLDNNHRTAIIQGSILNTVGIVGVNQDAGNFNNQANVVSVAVALEETPDPANPLPALANAQADASQLNIFNDVSAVESLYIIPGDPTSGLNVVKYDLIDGSINTNTGIVGVNQSVGNINNQANQVSVAAATNALVALSEADLGQINAANRILEFGTVKVDTINNSINGNTGIVGVNQSAGNMNNQMNMVSIAATIP